LKIGHQIYYIYSKRYDVILIYYLTLTRTQRHRLQQRTIFCQFSMYYWTNHSIKPVLKQYYTFQLLTKLHSPLDELARINAAHPRDSAGRSRRSIYPDDGFRVVEIAFIVDDAFMLQ